MSLCWREGFEFLLHVRVALTRREEKLVIPSAVCIGSGSLWIMSVMADGTARAIALHFHMGSADQARDTMERSETYAFRFTWLACRNREYDRPETGADTCSALRGLSVAAKKKKRVQNGKGQPRTS